MVDFRNIEGVYFVGIGGIGMSALALYFAGGGYTIAGYDRSESLITRSLTAKGCTISFEDQVSSIPDLFAEPVNKSKVLIVYTPAIAPDNSIISFFRNNGYLIHKRSEILGKISASTDTLAISGTHGKTTVSAMLAHLLKQSHVDCTAFLGGISKNYDTNLLFGTGRYTVMEADEFDRSFHRLEPTMAVVTSLDADHLDIYGDHNLMVAAYNEFCGKIRPGGNLLVNRKIADRIIPPLGINCFTYGLEKGCDYQATDIIHENDYYRFSLLTPGKVIKDLRFTFPGIINIENFTAAAAIALMCGVEESEIRKAVILFQGVKRRFDIRVKRADHVYIDDYAHHPEEIRVLISSIREYFGGRKITGIFQPHLFTRTRDNADGFAASLDELDEAILLPIYPARENPIEGVTSDTILSRMKSGKKKLLKKEDIPGMLDIDSIDILLTIGAGDIETLVKPIEEKMGGKGN